MDERGDREIMDVGQCGSEGEGKNKGGDGREREWRKRKRWREEWIVNEVREGEKIGNKVKD